MTQAEKSNLLKQNTLCWLAALVAPLILHLGLSSTKFPWPLVLPLLLLGPMLASNKLLAKASGEATDDLSQR